MLFIKTLRRFSERISPRQRGTLALSIPIACTITIFTAWMISRVSTQNAEEWVEHTEKVISKSNGVLLSLTTLEANVHRDALKGQVFDLEEFEQASQRVNQTVILVDQLISDNPSQQQVWGKVKALQQKRLDHLQQLLSELQPSRFPGRTRLPISSLNQGQRSMDSLRQSIETFQSTERQLLRARRQRLNQMLKTSTVMGWSLLVGSLLSSFGAMSLFWILDTERTKKSIELSHSQQLASAIADSVVDGVIVTDAQGQVTAFNPSALRMFGYQAEAVCDRPVQDFLDVIPQLPSAVEEADLSPEPFLKTQGIRKDGRRFPVEVSISENIAYQQRLLIVRDMTVRRAAQQRLEQYATDLEQLNQILSLTNRTLTSRNRELEQFAYLASHDLKAPLRAIMNLSSWLEEDLEEQLPPENREQFQLLRGRVSRMERLIDGLALYASIGQSPIKAESISVEEIIQDVLEELNPPEHLHIGSDARLPTIQGDRSYLRQIFAQLIDNAIKFHEGETGNILITAKEVDSGWEFAVIDDGPGIEEAYHQKIFQVFQTLVPRDQLESTGIGLAIVSKILMTIGGEIQVDSAAGQGATFQFTWPKPPPSLPIDGARKA